jgi:hypothetical protein
MGRGKQSAGAALVSADGAAPLSSIWHFRGIVLREVPMSQHEEQSFKIVAGFAVVGALVIAAVMALV